MRSHRGRAVLAALALFCLLSVVVFHNAAREPASSVATDFNRHSVVATDAMQSPDAISGTAPSRRFLSLDSLIGYPDVRPSVSFSLLFWIAAAVSSGALLLSAGLGRRGRAPPLVHA